MKENLRGIYWLIAFSFTDSLLLNVVRYVSPNVHIFQIICIGNMVAFLLSCLWVMQAKAGFKTNNLKLHSVRVGFETIGASIMFYTLSIMQAAEVRSIMFLTPVFASLVAVLILKEKNSPERWLVLVAGLIGVVIILRPDEQVIKLVSLLPILSSLIFSLGMNIIKKCTASDPPMRIAFYFTLLQSLISLPIMIWFWQPLEMEGLIGLIGIGFLFFLCHVTINLAFSKAPLTVLAPFMFLGLIFTSIIGYFVNNEFPGINVFIGGAFIVSAVSYTAYRESKKKGNRYRC